MQEFLVVFACSVEFLQAALKVCAIEVQERGLLIIRSKMVRYSCFGHGHESFKNAFSFGAPFGKLKIPLSREQICQNLPTRPCVQSNFSSVIPKLDLRYLGIEVNDALSMAETYLSFKFRPPPASTLI